MNPAEVGRRGEKLARALLKKRGYKIIETNAHGYYGEIDIVAKTKDCHVFAEVRTRTTNEFGTPEESVNQRKQHKLVTCALDYVATHEGFQDKPWRIDVVAIELDEKGNPTRTDIIENAVPLS